MKIAALILAHHRPDLLARLIDRLSGDLWNTYVHLDAKSNASEFSGIPSTALLRRYRVSWGGYSTIRATLSLIERALLDEENTHFYLMSGQCFPIKTDAQIAETVDGSGNCMTIWTVSQWPKPLERLTQWHLPLATGKRTATRLLNAFPRDVGKLLHGIEPRGGGQWWLLDRPSLEAMMRFVHRNAWFPRAFRWSLLPDEMFFQTLAAHVGVAAARSCPTFTKWVDEHPEHPLPLDEHILSEAKRGWHLMARKFVN